jgi:hypothetical protein
VTAAASVRFIVEPSEALTSDEQQMLARLSALDGACAPGPAGPFHMHIVSEPAWQVPGSSDLPDLAPARLVVVDGRIRVLHRRYLAEVDPVASAGWLYRTEAHTGLNVVLRLAQSCQLPLVGGLPLHAAGVVLDGAGLAFFGPSGAGKSTLAACFDGPLLSDELVAVAGQPFRLWGTGFWGEFEGDTRSAGSAPLAALVELIKGSAFSIERLDVSLARRRLLDVILVPLETRLWSAALAVLGRLVHAVPVYRMVWSPSAPPWPELRQILLHGAAPAATA